MPVLTEQSWADGVDPRFVFKLRSESGFGDEHTLELRNLEVLGQNDDATYFVLAGDGGAEFAETLRQYGRGQDVEGGAGVLKTLYNNIDSIELYGPMDRSGPGMDGLPASGLVTIDITLWPSEDMEGARERMTLLELVVAEAGGRVLAKTTHSRFSLARCLVEAEAVGKILDLYVIESVRTPPVPFVDPSDWRDLESAAISIDWTESASIGVLDDMPVATHPILSGHVLVEAPVLELGRPWNAPGRHGTMVAGLALNSDYALDVRSGTTINLSGRVVAIRVLEPATGLGEQTQFPPETLPAVLVVDSIRKLHAAHNVRVFNLSFGYDLDFQASHVGEFSEMLDSLVRELDIVIVVAAGNVTMPYGGVLPSGLHVGRDYPNYMDHPAHGMAQPANAALVLTVGGIAVSDSPVENNPPRLDRRAVASVGHVSPFSRTGPGHGVAKGRLNKPDLVAPAGNVIVDDLGFIDTNDQATGVLSTAIHSSGSMFYSGRGTSFAAPSVAADVAAVLHTYPDASANLLRALVASSASQPHGAQLLSGDESKQHNRYGFGIVSRDNAVGSGPQRATMMFDGEIAVDTSVIHPVPMPKGFVLPPSSTRSVRIALAFDPPVRRTRREYTAATMTIDAYRGVTLEELERRLVLQNADDPQPLISGRRRLNNFRPPPTMLKESTLQVQDWFPRRMNVDDGDTYFVVVTHATRTWYRNRDDYTRQRYALSVSLIDEAMLELDLMQAVSTSVSLPARVHQRVRI